MFTGIVEELGVVKELSGHRLIVGCSVVSLDSAVGASLAVNGTCLTVIANEHGTLSFDLSDETIARTSLRRLAPGGTVNLERPVSLASRLGGHVVQGHVDGVGDVVHIGPDAEGGATLRVRIPERLMRYVVEKGSIAVDGVSLTVADVHEDEITISLIPHTLSATTLGAATAGDPVNLEVDVLAKYVERMLENTRR